MCATTLSNIAVSLRDSKVTRACWEILETGDDKASLEQRYRQLYPDPHAHILHVYNDCVLLQGDPGLPGNRGGQGKTGDVGWIGDDGDMGVKGMKGIDGDEGDKGEMVGGKFP